MNGTNKADRNVAETRRRRMTGRQKFIALTLGIGLTCISLNAAATSMPSRPVVAQTASEKIAPHLFGVADVAPAFSLTLGELSANEKQTLQSATAENKFQQVGIGRALTKSQRRIDLESLQWTTTPNGVRYATLEFVTTGARASRLGITPTSIPKGVSVYVYGTTDNSIYGPFTASELRASGITAGKPYWLPVIEGETIRLELQASAKIVLDGQALDVPMVSHLVASVRGNPLKNLTDLGHSGSCNIDIACIPPSSATWVTRGNAVAKYYLTTSAGQTGICTGTLINSVGASPPPYFITANHCVNTTAEATSMHFYWFFQRATCGGANPTAPLTETLGATFINAVVVNDETLVRLNTAPPVGAVYSGWNSAAITAGDTMVALHHPAGDVKKYSDGANQGFAAYLNTATNNTASHIRMRWNNGTTEGGSSGSGLFNAAGELVGTLHGGDAACTALTSPDWYGRFDQAYPTLQPWLTPGVGGPPPPQPPPTAPSTDLTSGVAVSSSVQEGEDIWYRIVAASNTTSVTVTLTNLNADADIYVFKDTQNGTPACTSELLNTSNETCTITITAAGNVYIDVYGYRAANYTVTATLTNSTPPASGGSGGGGGGGALSETVLALLTLLALMRVAAMRRLHNARSR